MVIFLGFGYVCVNDICDMIIWLLKVCVFFLLFGIDFGMLLFRYILRYLFIIVFSCGYKINFF